MNLNLKGLSNTSIKPLGECNLKIDIGENCTKSAKALIVTDMSFDLIIGHETMKAWELCIDYATNEVIIDNKNVNKENGITAFVQIIEIEYEDLKKRFREKVSPNLTLTQQEKLINVLMENKEAFSVNGELGLVKSKYCKITLKSDSQPFKSQPYRVSIAERTIIKERIDELLKKGLIRKSCSDYTSPIILVSKGHKDSSGEKNQQRLVVDLRRLNKIAVNDNHPVPYMDSTLEALAGNNYFFSLDAEKGFWQLELEEASRKFTAFVCWLGIYEWTVLPFGFCNSSAIFQREMEEMLQDLLYVVCVVYVDDIIGFGVTFEEFLRNLEEVLGRCIKYGLKLKIDKCSFGHDEIDCLGHRVGKNGIKPDPKKVMAIQDIRTPSTIKEIRSFLGITGFFRKFIPQYAQLSKPLTRLLEKDNPFLWTPEQKRAFEELKSRLCSAPILRPFKAELRTILHIDASDYGVGSTLLQEEDNEERVVGYASRMMSSAEKNYSVTQKELLSLIHALKTFRHFLHMRRFEVITDHLNLVNMNFAHDVSCGRLLRWAVRLQDYDFVLKYKPGRLHNDADGLSRLPITPKFLPEEDSAHEFPIYSISIEENEKLQLQDTFCNNIRELLTKGDKRAVKRFTIKEGRLYNVERGNLRYVVPKTLVHALIYAHHGSETMAHVGFGKIYDQIRSKFYWAKMKATILKEIARCKTCKTAKHSTQRRYGFLQPIEVNEVPFDLWGMDFFGPVTTSPNGNKYLLVAVEYLTKFVLARPFSNANAEAVVTFLQENVIPIFGAPKAILTDRAKIFFSGDVRQLCTKWGIQQKYTSGYHSAGNGMSERMIQSITTLIRCEIENKQDEWEDALPVVLHLHQRQRSNLTDWFSALNQER
ncbi:Transposon Tf2-6 polyprotein [Orchesella cincta]|uniref:RNA-directed DNA polymerase n=1 Tax=Orchesella cincta TaxID=48709 RepID=A0A1D2M200_ORCCI|nr:Transposon Tf2-6 polyprotein [Orchesella cincta]